MDITLKENLAKLQGMTDEDFCNGIHSLMSNRVKRYLNSYIYEQN